MKLMAEVTICTFFVFYLQIRAIFYPRLFCEMCLIAEVCPPALFFLLCFDDLKLAAMHKYAPNNNNDPMK